MQHQTIKGLVIRETDFGDADRYITVLTESGARIEVLCKGVRRRNSRMAAAVRLFCWSELTLYQGRGKYTLTDAALLHSFWGVTADMETYALCCYFTELATAMTDENEEVPQVTRLFLYALRAVADQKREQKLVKAAFELRLMAESGFLPDLAVCGACQNPIEGTVYFSVREGVVLDEACLRRLGGGDFVALPQGTYAAMAHILTCDVPRVFAFALGGASLDRLAGVCEKYALYYAERGFASLEFYHSLFA
ncbi:MAG: DNA repair protein RecO [Butyricicoccus sp.]